MILGSPWFLVGEREGWPPMVVLLLWFPCPSKLQMGQDSGTALPPATLTTQARGDTLLPQS
jgi:hypothetical protein